MDITNESGYLLKIPRQDRARATVDALIQATELLLVEEGWGALNTNRVAQRAGVSIGTLYQYFANKEAMVGLMVERFVTEQQDLLGERLMSLVVQSQDFETLLPEIVQALMATHQERPELSRALFMHVPASAQLGLISIWTRRSRELVILALQMGKEMVREDLDVEMAAHLLVTALHGIIYSTIIEDPALLSDERLLGEMSTMILNFLRPVQSVSDGG